MLKRNDLMKFFNVRKNVEGEVRLEKVLFIEKYWLDEIELKNVKKRRFELLYDGCLIKKIYEEVLKEYDVLKNEIRYVDVNENNEIIVDDVVIMNGRKYVKMNRSEVVKKVVKMKKNVDMNVKVGYVGLKKKDIVNEIINNDLNFYIGEALMRA